MAVGRFLTEPKKSTESLYPRRFACSGEATLDRHCRRMMSVTVLVTGCKEGSKEK